MKPLPAILAEAARGDFTVSTDPARLDRDLIYRYLSGESYWARGMQRERLERALEHSLCFGVYEHREHRESRAQVGFARLVTDCATFAYLADVFILDSHRGHGLGKWLLSFIHALPEVQGLRRWMLLTRDAQGLYAQLGWQPPSRPEWLMERFRPDVPSDDAPAAT